VDAEDRGAAGLIAASVAAAATALVAAVAALRSLAPSEAAADLAEAGVLAGAVLGLVLVVAVARIQAAGAAGRQLRALLDVALPHQAAAAFLADPETSARVERAPGTVIFCDLRGFSAAVERHGLDRLRGRLEAALGAVVDAHVAEDLLVDKLLGDAVMSFRAGSLVRGDAGEHARRCVRAALASQRAVAALRDPDFAGVKVGGASAPDLWVGAFTGGRRLAFTALHDRVNVAARLEAACGALGTETLFDRATVDVAGPMDGVVWRRAGRIAVHGKVEVLEVWEALPSEVDGPWRALFGDALQAFENGDRDPTAFVAVDRARPGGDALARVYADRCATQGSDPVLRLVK
jgi:class 3 adenylate cyclase